MSQVVPLETSNLQPDMLIHTNDLAGQKKQNTLKSERWVVQKFGGTSLGHFATNIAKNIIRPGALEHRVAVVCSAISRSTKENGTTNRLLLACSELQTDGAGFSRFIDGMQLEHVQAAMRDIQSLSIREELIERIRYECASVIKILDAAYFLGEVSPACVGRVVSAGERLSCHYLVAILQDIGLQASFVDVTNLNLALSSPIDSNDGAFVGRVATELSEKILSVSGIPIITGYLGLQPAGGLLALVGRGYTDLCAALVATGLEATQLQIWKEFDGVFTADPHHVPDAILLSHLTFSELRGLTSYGSQVVHTAAVDVARDQNLLLSIRNVSNLLNPGTLVTQGVGDPETQFMAITIKRYMATLNLRNSPHYSGIEFQNKVLEILQKFHLNGELLTTSAFGLSLAVCQAENQGFDADQLAEARLWRAIEALQAISTAVDVNYRVALLCVVCRLAESTYFALHTALQVLMDLKIPVCMVMHDAVDRIAGCVVEEHHANLAAKILHQNLLPMQRTRI